MRRQIYGSIFVTALVSALLMSFLILYVMYGQFYNESKNAIKEESGIIAAGYRLSGENLLEELDSDAYRVTLIAPDGTVLYDSVGDPAQMENHGDRPEVKAALEKGMGDASRASETIGKQTYYYAVRLHDGNILRVAGTTDSVLSAVWACLPYTVLGIAGIAVLSAVAAGKRTRGIIRPINSLNLDEPLQNDVYEELSPLLTRIEKQHREIRGKAAELQKKQDEFAAITGSMSEGLIVLGSGGSVLSMNQSAAALYGLEGGRVGLDFVEIDRSLKLQDIIRTALGGKKAEIIREMHGRQYQYLASPVLFSGKTSGVILLIIDITDRMKAEQQRREFTANVSHELKTPLQSIMGSAELMKNGLVKSEDTQRFTERIYNEAQHLVAMIEDIIRLSQLDERKSELPKEDVELTALASEVAERLHDAARERHVDLEVHGGPVHILGVRRLLWEIVYNLCDNAIRYNRSGGKVVITVASGAEGTLLTVADTGIGIPKEDQARVFERFYRVDKSHARDTGGTGLGLSIVKHAAQHLGAEIHLDSKLDVGTTVTVRFPNKD